MTDGRMLTPIVLPVIPSRGDDDGLTLEVIPRPKLSEIREAVCEFYCVTREEIESDSRYAFIVVARQTYCFLAHRYTSASLSMIGARVGGKDHSTVWHAVRQIRHRAATRPLVREDLDLLRRSIFRKVELREFNLTRVS